jgi:hypothetical protein
MSYTIKHMGLGGILDQAIAITRDHFKLLFTIMLLLLIPFSLLQGFIMFSIQPALPPDPTPEDYLHQQEVLASYWPLIGILVLVQALVVLPVTNGAVIAAVARLYLGKSITAMEAIAEGFRRLGPLLLTSILVYLAVVGGLMLCIIPGIYFSIWFGLAQHVVMIERLSGVAALKRSKQLVHKDRGTFLALIIVMIVISFLIGAAAVFIPQPHLELIASTLLQALTTILWTAALVVFYFSCRCNVENFDLHYLAEAIGAEPVAIENGQMSGGMR